MAGVRSFYRGVTPLGASHTAAVPIYVDSDNSRLKMIPAGSGTAETVIQEASGAASQSILTAAATLVAQDSGKTFYLALAGGFTVALPAPAVGLRYRFFVQIAPTTAYIITATNLAGLVFSSTGGDASSITAFTGVDIRFVANTALIGDSADFWSDGTNWYCWAFCDADAGITVN
mgnify:CR=1 FL=1